MSSNGTSRSPSVFGYCDPWSIQPGERTSVKISAQGDVRVRLLRVMGAATGGDASFPTEPVDGASDSVTTCVEQPIPVGSYAVLPITAPSGRQIELDVHPTLLGSSKAQTIVHWPGVEGRGVELSVSEGTLKCSVDGNLVAGLGALSANWHRIALRLSGDERIEVSLRRLSGWAVGPEQVHVSAEADPGALADELWLARTSGDATSSFNGKIGRVLLLDADGDALHRWHFGYETATRRIVDLVSDECSGRLFTRPTRNVTGSSWDGRSDAPADDPDAYDAVHFHEDDTDDFEWPEALQIEVPSSAPSGVYVVELSHGDSVDNVPLFVRDAPTEERNGALLLFPTNTYLAYGNDRLHELDLSAVVAHEIELHPSDEFLQEHPEFGASNYDTHLDGSGIVYSGRRRPVLNMRPDYVEWLNGSMRHFAADLLLLEWLIRRSRPHGVATDEDLDRDGIDLLNQYDVLITGSHPEYWTHRMHEPLREYLASGGRMMYLGADGFAWVTSVDLEDGTMEARNGHTGTRTWNSGPGELCHSISGERGGLWRHRGWPTQALCGVGFAAQGWGKTCGYDRLEDSYSPQAAFIFDGVEEEVIGDFGLVMGGAVGDEIDRVDAALGTPAHALHLATSQGLDDYYQVVQEDLLLTTPGHGGSEDERVRADMVFFEIEGGGAVFSVGSINWAGALAYDAFDNNVARVSDNVLDRFLSSATGPLASSTTNGGER